MSRRVLGVAIAASIAGWGLAAEAADEPANIIKYRQSTMTAIGGHMAVLAALAKGEVSFTDEAPGHAHAIEEMSKNIGRLFPEGTGQGDTEVESEALPAIWEKPDEFEAAVVVFQEESQKLAQAADSGDPTAFAQQLDALGKNGCGTCHDGFRAE